MLTKSGAKLMDFGPAKAAVTSSGSQSERAPLLFCGEDDEQRDTALAGLS